MDVVLLGVLAPHVENQSLAVLGRALADAGFESRAIAFRGFAGMNDMLRDVLSCAPRICGVSLQTTEALLATLTFTRLLRKRGYRGTIVVGGHVATLCAETILARDAGVDVVVELAGEEALVGLARGEDPRSLPGAITAAGRGLPAHAVTPRGWRHAKLSEHLGVGVADLVASRGCAAHCGYCCVAAISDRAEATGSPRQQALAIDAVADEIAALAAEGARAIHVMDDNLLPLASDAALAWVRTLRDALASRGVPPIAFSLQLRADVVTSALADELAALGLVRAYLGIDGYSPGQLRAIGRSAPADAGVRAIAALRARGVYCVANALLVGPTIGFETIAAEIDGLAAIEGAPVHLLPIEARPGTVYHRRASARSLIEGGPLWPVHRFEDPRSFWLSEVVTGLPTRLLERSVSIALYDLAWALGVARRLAPSADIASADETWRDVTDAWNADQTRLLRAARDAARDGEAAIRSLLAAEQAPVRALDERLIRACDQALSDVERAVSRMLGRPVRAHARGRWLGGLAFAMGLAAACSSPDRSAEDAAVPVDVVPDALAACADGSRSSQWNIDQDATCECGDAYVAFTFDANGVVTNIAGAQGSTLSPEIRDCVLALLEGHCYPSLAGMTRELPTCHSWIA